MVRRWLDVTGADDETRGRIAGIAEEALVEVASYRSIFRVVTADTPTRRAPMCAFLITRFPPEADEPTIVQVELPAVEMTFVGVDDVFAFESVWKQMAEAALDSRQSADFIAELPRE